MHIHRCVACMRVVYVPVDLEQVLYREITVNTAIPIGTKRVVDVAITRVVAQCYTLKLILHHEV